MKTIYCIAKAELQNLFYSPIAWLILIIFTFQSSLAFSDSLDGMVTSKYMGYGTSSATNVIFGGWSGLLNVIQGYLYLYIPLITMNLMSREYGTGSIKLLYSSPITNTQIILGKYLSMLIYSLILVGIILIYVIYAGIMIDNLDYPQIFTGLLGAYFLMCAYSAIGLFMSSLTSYQVVAAIGTLTTLAILNYVKDWWQSIEFVRDITYWLSITGRSGKFVSGLICSEDVIYFIVVVVLFLSMTIVCLQSKRQKRSAVGTFGRYAAIWAAVILIAYVSSRPALMSYYDATYTKGNTLTPNSQDIIRRSEGGLKITTYVNLLEKYFWIGLPVSINDDIRRFEQYVRFKPEIEMEYVYYYDSTLNESLGGNEFKHLSLEEKVEKIIKVNKLDKDDILSREQLKAKHNIDLRPEGNRFVRVLENEKGNKTFLRIFDDNMIFPSETEISAALKRIVMDLPNIGFLTGHDERSAVTGSDRAYSMVTQAINFRHSLINQGFDFEILTLEKEIPEEISILVIAEMKKGFTDVEQVNFDKYIARGGNLFIIGESGRQDVMNPIIEQFGTKFMDGCLVQPSRDFTADLVISHPTKESSELSYIFKQLYNGKYGIATPTAAAIEYTTDKGYNVMPIFATSPEGCWNELQTTNFIDEKPVINTETGEVEKSYTTAIALLRDINNIEQKIVILGDADCISNGELSKSRNIRTLNYFLLSGSFHWFSNGEVPIDTRRSEAIDNVIDTTENQAKVTRIILVWVLSGLMLLSAILLWIRRRSR